MQPRAAGGGEASGDGLGGAKASGLVLDGAFGCGLGAPWQFHIGVVSEMPEPCFVQCCSRVAILLNVVWLHCGLGPDALALRGIGVVGAGEPPECRGAG
eukprot:4696165-Alexandrium_andersonii.AAC.1